MLSVGVGLLVVSMAACGSAPAKIPAASGSPSATPTSIAPGLLVSPAQLTLPPFTVSTTNPLPSGVSAKQVVRDVVIDNLIENAAVARPQSALLAYADAGNLLASEMQEISTDQTENIHVLEIHDDITSIEVGSKVDPNDASAQIAAIVRGSETRRQRTGSDAPGQTSRSFDVLLWVVLSPASNRYLLCDSADV